MLTVSSADSLLKNVYLDVICNQLNAKTNPFYAAIERSSMEIAGKQAVIPLQYGINGGYGSGTDSGTLPRSSSAPCVNLTVPIKNLFGTIEISDRAIRASRDSSGAVVDLLNREIEGLLEAAKFNFSRMLWQDGTGTLATIGDMDDVTTAYDAVVTDTKNLMEGMVIDFVRDGEVYSSGHKIEFIDRTANTISFNPAVETLGMIEADDIITLQQSYNSEINGLPYVFGTTATKYFNVTRANYQNIFPATTTLTGVLTAKAMQGMIDEIETRSGGEINMILCSKATRREYLEYLESTRTNVDYMNLDGGFKALSFNGIPVYADKFAPEGNMYFVNTDDFKMLELCDWQWLESSDGRILTQLERTPAYTGTLVKYANVVCVRPMRQGYITGITDPES